MKLNGPGYTWNLKASSSVEWVIKARYVIEMFSLITQKAINQNYMYPSTYITNIRE